MGLRARALPVCLALLDELGRVDEHGNVEGQIAANEKSGDVLDGALGIIKQPDLFTPTTD